MIKPSIFSMSFLLLVSCASSPVPHYPYDPASQYDLTERDFRFLHKKAIKGDGAAARDISDYYFSQNKVGEGVFWLRLSAEAGHCDSRKRIAEIYSRSDTSMGEYTGRWSKERTCD